MQYWQHMDCKNIDEVISRIKLLTNLKSWAIITHDKDVLPNGQLKPAHFHCVLTFSNAKTIKSIADAIGVEMQYIEKIRTTTKTARLYLIHRNNPEKYQYSPEEVKASFDYVTYVDDCPVKQQRESIAERIERGEIKQYNLCKYVNIDEYSRNYRYYQKCFEYRQNKLKGLDRNMECIFVTGGSGTGKTSYAKMIASQKGYACYISSGGKNPLDNYQGEECIILDDTRSSTWNLTDFLKLTDNHTDSLVGCRYYNKSIAECKLLIVTSVKSLDEFYENATKEDNEPKIQLLRRFSMVVEMTMESMTIKYYDENLMRHIPAFRVRNPITTLFEPKVAKQAVADFVRFMGLEIVEECQPAFKPIEDEEEIQKIREIFNVEKEMKENDR
jgi:adenosyl cobinamide kinase/adenosyl cobinamide phosphate guanylyltransferase